MGFDIAVNNVKILNNNNKSNQQKVALNRTNHPRTFQGLINFYNNINAIFFYTKNF